MNVTPAEIVDLTNALDASDALSENEFYLVLRIVLVKRATDFQKFDSAYNRFWHAEEVEEDRVRQAPRLRAGTLKLGKLDLTNVRQSDPEGTQPEIAGTFVIYSPVETNRLRRFDGTTNLDWREQRRAMKILRRYFASRPGRRFRKAHQGQIDPKQTIRSNLIHAGELLKLVRRRRQLSRAKFLFLCDVSGSMEGQTTELMLMLDNICRSNGGTEIFAFSTRLVRLTDYFRYLPREATMRALSERTDLWGSGTKIGHCLRLFNSNFPLLVDERTVSMIISDGWDLGDIEMLNEELARLRRRSRALVWLNPLADERNFEPTSAGMAAAMNYIDLFSSTKILKDIGKLRRRLGNAVEMPRIVVQTNT